MLVLLILQGIINNCSPPALPCDTAGQGLRAQQSCHCMEISRVGETRICGHHMGIQTGLVSAVIPKSYLWIFRDQINSEGDSAQTQILSSH